MANNSKEVVEENAKTWTLESLITYEKVRQLEEVLAKYPDILLQYTERKNPDVYPDILILETFTFEKPLTSVEIDDLKPKRVLQFIEDLRKFFFVTYKHDEIHISRFRTLCDIAIGKLGERGEEVRLSDRYADLAGLFYGYSPKQIVEYCLKRGLYDLIKQ